jgi:hypothetical protein
MFRSRRTGTCTTLAGIAVALVCAIVSIADAGAQSDAASRRRPAVCTEQYAPVCGETDGKRRTYGNACFAAAAGAKVVAAGPCR